MIDINKEAEEYAENQLKEIVDKTSKFECVNDFITGHNSKATQAKVIQGQIDVLENLEQATMSVFNKIQELKQQLKELEK